MTSSECPYKLWSFPGYWLLLWKFTPLFDGKQSWVTTSTRTHADDFGVSDLEFDKVEQGVARMSSRIVNRTHIASHVNICLYLGSSCRLTMDNHWKGGWNGFMGIWKINVWRENKQLLLCVFGQWTWIKVTDEYYNWHL